MRHYGAALLVNNQAEADMKRIVFVENKGKTVFWSAVAELMERRGNIISWIVQNPLETPAGQAREIVKLRFPNVVDMRFDVPIPKSVETDRGRTLFGAGRGHYSHYEVEISRALRKLRPDVVIGESTLFHELMIISACQDQGIPYLHPTGTRYPGGRMVVFAGNTQTPVVGSGETWTESQLEVFTEVLKVGSTLPDYMRTPSPSEALLRKLRLFSRQSRSMVGYWRGERFNTPSLARKTMLWHRLKVNLAVWKSLERTPNQGQDAGPVILYALQMQPEANIEVWGRPFHDQVKVIERCLSALPSNGQLAVKANPKAKYEVSDALLALVRKDQRIVLLPLDWTMPQAQAVTVGTVTVTGTVGYEAVFGRGRCISLRHPIMAELFPSLHADTPEEAVTRLLTDAAAGRGTPEMARQLLERIVASSFPGVINEPAYDVTCMSQENLIKVCNALTQACDAVMLERELM